MSAEALAGVRARIDAARESAGRGEVRLVAVSKTKPVEALLSVYEAGHRDFGENYVKEMVDKAGSVPDDVRFHFIGHLQSNKARALVRVPQLASVQCVDKPKLADRLDAAWADERGGDAAPLDVYVQVNTSGEASKFGCEPGDAPALAAHVRDRCARLRLAGLMTIGRAGDSRSGFESLAACRGEVARGLGLKEDDLRLSMGMSADFELAVELGATDVRVGSTIFGARDYSKGGGGGEEAKEAAAK